MKLRSDGISWREIDGEMVILDLTNSKYLTTNRTGAVLLRLLAEEQTVDALIDHLVAEFGVPRERAAGDVEGFVRLLREKDLLDGGKPQRV